MLRRKRFSALWFLLPYVVIFFIFRMMPSLASIYISLTRWSIVGSPQFIGLANFTALFKDPTFYKALVNNLNFLIIILPSLVILSLLCAVALNSKIPGRNVVRTITIIPYVIIPAVVGIMWNWMYDANFGIINFFLSKFGVRNIGWLIDRNIALFSVSIVIIWAFLGYNMVLYLAGLQEISPELQEAAQIDGANKRQTFFYITIPLLKRTTSLIITLSIINVMQVYDQVVVMTGGGPSLSTLTLLQYQYIQGFERQQLGYGSAIGVVILFILILLVQVKGLFFKSDKEIA